ncbi:PqiC family protein [Robbsia andropogonis]|uniref:PqiC family protein n=1 Tax=Robbsia andropogonis TaxID=28092 RepID=UPI0006984C08|nr:PqiC family protein [Robbsia andropogonis]MCP1118352.1 PqiC family protein [Robbsia andropogonis]MCP1127869.1 PqiC family protein [Robbsia andropogonis]
MTMRRTQNYRRGRLALGSSLFLGLALAGCANSPDSQYYTLSGGGTGAISTTCGAQRPAQNGQSCGTADPAHPLMIEMTPVNIPDAVARPQLVTSTKQGQVDIQDYHRWSGPLADEIGGALSTSLTQALPAIDVYRAPRPKGATVYQLTVNIRRFESVPGERATIDAVWSVVRSTDHLTMTCQSIVSQPVASGYDALVAGHRKALARVANDIGAAIQQERAEPVRMPMDSLDTIGGADKGGTAGKGTSGKMPANAGLGSTASGVAARSMPLPVLLCPSNAATSD